MPIYRYNARDARGLKRAGTIDAADARDAVRKLRKEGLFATNVRVGSREHDAEQIRTRLAARAVKREEVISFSEQMAIMLETGVPLSEALGAYLAQTKQNNLKRIIEIVADRIHSGVSFSGSIGEFPNVFPQLMVSLIQASEASGALGRMLSRVSEYLANDQQTRKQIKGALAYPLAMVTMALLVTSFLVVWVLPRFAKIYESRKAALPKPTELLLWVSTTIQQNWVILLIAAAALIAGSVAMVKSNRGRYMIDFCKVRGPVIGQVYTSFYVSRVARTLSTLLAAGVTLPDAIAIVRKLTNNRLWDKLWKRIDASLTSGGTMSEVIQESPLVPPSFGQMIGAGERTGQLPDVLDKVAEVAEKDLKDAVKSATQMIEPLMITFMGVMIGGVAIALLLPIFTMGSMMAK